jgi:hypothetical protein
MRSMRRSFTTLALWSFAFVVIAAELPRADPEAVGLSSERLANIKKVFDAMSLFARPARTAWQVETLPA